MGKPAGGYAVLLVLFVCGSSCDRPAAKAWPPIPFVVLDEDARFIFERCKDFQPSAVERVLVFPVLRGYRYRGVFHDLAIVDPIITTPGKETLSDLAAACGHETCEVVQFLVLARGYCPEGLGRGFYYVGERGGQEFRLVELARLPEAQAQRLSKIIVNELCQKELRLVDRKLTVEEALDAGVVLGTTEIVSPVAKCGKYAMHFGIVLWEPSYGTRVSVCIGAEALASVRRELGVEEQSEYELLISAPGESH